MPRLVNKVFLMILIICILTTKFHSSNRITNILILIVCTSGILIISLIWPSQVFVGFKISENLNILADLLIIHVVGYCFSAEAICSNGDRTKWLRTKWYGQNGIWTKCHWTKWYRQNGSKFWNSIIQVKLILI